MTWASANDFKESWIGPNCPSDDSKIELWLARAERKVRRDVPDIVGRLATVSPDHEPDLPETVRDVVVDMVTRVFRNPDQARTRASATGPLTGSVTYGGDNPGSLSLTAENLEDLAPPDEEPTGAQRAFSIDLAPAAVQKHPLAHSWVNGPQILTPQDPTGGLT